jgi:hypothetical protein
MRNAHKILIGISERKRPIVDLNEGEMDLKEIR